MHDFVIIFLFMFSGDGETFDMSEIAGQVNILKKEVSQMESVEQRLDKDIVIVEHYVNQVTKDLANQKYYWAAFYFFSINCHSLNLFCRIFLCIVHILNSKCTAHSLTIYCLILLIHGQSFFKFISCLQFVLCVDLHNVITHGHC